jgi:hypothetical protein
MEQREGYWTSSGCSGPLAGAPAASHVTAVQAWALAPTAFAAQHGSFTGTSARSGRALFRLICVLERGIAFACPANLMPASRAQCRLLSSYQARAAM